MANMFEFARGGGEAIHDDGSTKAAACQELIARTEFAAIYIGSENLCVSNSKIKKMERSLWLGALDSPQHSIHLPHQKTISQIALSAFSLSDLSNELITSLSDTSQSQFAS